MVASAAGQHARACDQSMVTDLAEEIAVLRCRVQRNRTNQLPLLMRIDRAIGNMETMAPTVVEACSEVEFSIPNCLTISRVPHSSSADGFCRGDFGGTPRETASFRRGRSCSAFELSFDRPGVACQKTCCTEEDRRSRGSIAPTPR
jgi:hypothetical protein